MLIAREQKHTEVTSDSPCMVVTVLASLHYIHVYADLNAQTLDAIETTFQQFHAFLDLINEKGFVSMAKCYHQIE